MALRTGEVAKQAGVNVETLRFYEREGLLPEPPRRTSGYREYPADTVDLIRFIKRAQGLGFSLRQVKDLLSLRNMPRQASKKAGRLVDTKLREIDDKIHDLKAIRKALSELHCACKRSESTSCPIIEALSSSRDDQV